MRITIDTLPEPVTRLIESKIKDGEYASPEEYVHSVLAREAAQAAERPTRRKAAMGMFDHLVLKVEDETVWCRPQNRFTCSTATAES